MLLLVLAAPATATLWYMDSDGDGFGDPDISIDVTTQPLGFVGNGDDCDDSNEMINPDAEEVCNAVDDDCDTQIDEDAIDGIAYYLDADMDGHGTDNTVIFACEHPGSGWSDTPGDCDDSDHNVFPGAEEYCNGIDDDCDDIVDEYAVDSLIFYEDLDRDGYGSDVETIACNSPGSDWSTETGDCDDSDPDVNPGAMEVCNDIDDNCDYEIDEPGSAGSILFYQDWDEDGFGVADVTQALCEWQPGWSLTPGDCDDDDPNINPAATDDCNGIDDDCDDIIDDGETAVEYWQDFDGDGYGDAENPPTFYCWDPGPGWVLNDLDCDDGDETINPNAIDVCDGYDNDCDGLVDDGYVIQLWYPDLDGDGYGDENDPGTLYCEDPGGWSLDPTDCDDGDPYTNPDAPDVWDGVDNNCDGTIDGVALQVEDVPNDQGRSVRVNWARHGEDAPATTYTITGYALYRRIDDPVAKGADLKAAPPGDWDFVGITPAHGDEVYHVLAPTLGDSNSYHTYLSVFFVRAQTPDPFTFFDSAIGTGYSIDNLAPGIPPGLLVEPVPGGSKLTWDESLDADLQYFRIYRGATADFPPDAGSLVHLTPQLTWIDLSADPAEPFYKVSAVDFNGNEGEPAVVEWTTGIAGGTPRAPVLHPNRPNPFNPVTTFAYELPGNGRVTLTIHSLDGRVVTRLVDAELPSGPHSVVWRGNYDSGRAAPSGVYLAQLVLDGQTVSRRVTLVR